MSSRTRSTQGPVTVEWMIGDWSEWGGSGGNAAFSDSTLLVTHVYQNPTQNASTAFAESKLIVYLLRCSLIGLAALFIVASGSPSTQETQRDLLKEMVGRSLTIEDMAYQTGNVAQFARLLDEDVEPSWYRSWLKNWQMAQLHASSDGQFKQSQVHSAYLFDGVVVAAVELNRSPDNPWQLNPVVETRFYRHPTKPLDATLIANTDLLSEGGSGWLRTTPTAEFWGEPLTLETAHLRFEYYARDAEVVEQAAPQIESFYVDFYRRLGGPEPTTDPKMTLVLIQSVDTKWDAPGYVIEMVSPMLMERSPELTQAETLVDAAYTRLSSRIMTQSIPGTRQYWNSVAVGLRTWLRTQLVDGHSPWHQQTDNLYYSTLSEHLPLSPLDIDDGRHMGLPMNDMLVWQYRVAQSMIEFSVEEYGEASLPRLVEGFSRSRRWSDLILYAYGLSAEEWEADWNDYLRRDVERWSQSQN